MIRHIVLTKFHKPDIEAPEAARRLRMLPALIPEIVSLEAGQDFLHSDRSYDLGLVVTFETKEDLAVYQEHPEHVKVKEYIHAHRTASVTVDYEF